MEKRKKPMRSGEKGSRGARAEAKSRGVKPSRDAEKSVAFDLERVLTDVSMSMDEYRYLCRILGREPNKTELGMVGALWSEHCSYKSSRIHLKKFPTEADWVVQGPGENAGAVDLGDGWLGVLKIESHNHPSAIEPHQGAATGVGGIVRDILALGARPVALLDALRFGPLDDSRNRYLLNGVVGGIADYGNCIGVPTVGGEISFSESFAANPIVNVMCFGLVRRGHMVRAHAGKPGLKLVLIGARTGRDGIHGATFASAELTEASQEQRPAVQVGDPFREKLLIEAILEITATIPVAGIQDLGAAGLTSAAVEMAARAGLGVSLDLEAVPLREKGMQPYEILLSESQERMLVIPQEGYENQVLKVARKWGLEGAIVGEIIQEPYVYAYWRKERVVDLPVAVFGELAPVYQRPVAEDEPTFLSKDTGVSLLEQAVKQESPMSLIRKVLSHPTVASKYSVYEQYDHMVQINTVRAPGQDAAVLRVKGANYLVALTVDGNSRYTALHAYEGGKNAVAEAARNLFAVGAQPLAVTDCLNFGNPEDPTVMRQFKDAVEGIAEGARVLGIPIVSGNVSFYNESPNGAIDPTPVVGMVGIVRKTRPPVHPGIGKPGDMILLIGGTKPEFGGSIVAEVLGISERLEPPCADLHREALTGRKILEWTNKEILTACHDLSEGGLIVGLVEMLAHSDPALGVSIRLPEELPWWVSLFSETSGRYVISTDPDHMDLIVNELTELDVPACFLGNVNDSGRVRIEGLLEVSRSDWVNLWETGLKR